MPALKFSLVILLFSVAAASAQAPSKAPPAKDPLSVDVPVPKGAQHIVINDGDKDAKKFFTYFPYPEIPRGRRTLPLVRSGWYRLEVSPAGDVTAITILRTMGRDLDTCAMKGFIQWKAKPGAFRVVDVPYTIAWSGGGSHVYP